MMYSKPQVMICDTCVWATRFKDGLRCIDGHQVDKDDGCRTWANSKPEEAES
jgi:hypothetical protein